MYQDCFMNKKLRKYLKILNCSKIKIINVPVLQFSVFTSQRQMVYIYIYICIYIFLNKFEDLLDVH